MRKKVTIQDIADELGVSRNTVSKAINNSDGLASATREKIIQKAVEMNYKQFSYVKTLAGITHSDLNLNDTAPEYYGEIALLTTQFLSQSHFSSLMLDTFQKEVSQLGYTLNTHRVSPDNIASMTLPITFKKDRVSAIMCIEMFDLEYDNMICELGLPTLFIDGPIKKEGYSLPCDQLYMDNYVEVTRFVNDMLKRGKKKIGFIGNYEHCQSFFERYTSYRLALLMANVEIDEKFVIKTNDKQEIESRIASLGELPDVFLCENDFVAMDVMSALSKNGIRVPDDVMMCGYDDSPESRIMFPALTTIHIHTQVMAFSAMQMLMSRIKEPTLDYRVLYTQCDLIYRASTGD